MSIRTFLTAAAVATGAVAAVGASSASAELTAPQQALAELCRAERGDFYVTPYAMARCQSARSREGEFAQEREICTQSLQGEFVTVEDYLGKNNRWLWVCR